jgi:hypothetical protein
MASATIQPSSAPSGFVPVEEDWSAGRLVLPGGILDNQNRCFQTVLVRQLTGRDEELLADRRYQNAARQITDFLAQVLVEVPGLNKPVSKELTEELLIGDRDYLLLRLRQIALGDQVEQVMRCPGTTCEQKADVEFQISELPVRRVTAVQPHYEFELSEPAYKDDPKSGTVVLRLPTGRDQDAILDGKDVNPAIANTRLFARIVKKLGRKALDEEGARNLPLKIRNELTAFLRRVAPGPDLKIEIQCPHCGADMTFPFDLYSFFLPSGEQT